MNVPYKEDYIFALDIGTRTVIGIVCRKEDNGLKIIGESIREHDCRSMIDGQVHDVERVSEVVTKVKEELEEKTGLHLERAAIAAAGRTLKTRLVHIEEDLGEDMDIDSTMVNGLELSGVAEATRLIKEESRGGKDHFYCVGYSIVSYYLNGYSISNLASQRGRHIGADVLATFLPQSVVNSLYRVLEKSGLKAGSLTLEPIAAIEAVVPDNIRLLNIALVDIGAGTSDIAITRGGTIAAYGMVPVAGDEITEAIAYEYLVDFNTAEHIKRSLGKKKKVTFKDITGLKRSVETGCVMETIKNASIKIAQEISKAMVQYNGGPPRAVFCVGGGSQTPFLLDAMSEGLDIDRQRIAVKKRDCVLNVEAHGKLLKGPEGVTVIGIAVMAAHKAGHDFVNIYINDRECRVFNSGDLSIQEVLGLIGYNPSSLIGRNGRSVRYTLNGEKKRVPGESPVPPKIYLNNAEANLETRVKNGDHLTIEDAVNGRDASASIREQALKYGMDLKNSIITINGSSGDGDYMIKDGDIIEVYRKNSSEIVV